jgi:hypothetical protein
MRNEYRTIVPTELHENMGAVGRHGPKINSHLSPLLPPLQKMNLEILYAYLKHILQLLIYLH